MLPDTSLNHEAFQDRAHWVFDLDNTLYSATDTLFPQVDHRMKEFIMDLLGVDRDEAHRIQKGHLVKHGLTMRGLMIENDVKPQVFLDMVHDLDFDSVTKDDELDQLLGRLEGTKYIFTNAPAFHAHEVLARLGISHHFDGLFDSEAANYEPKPEKSSFEGMISHFELDPTQAVMVEDTSRNLKPAAHMGMATLWVDTGCQWGRVEHDESYVHAATPCLKQWLSNFLDAPQTS